MPVREAFRYMRGDIMEETPKLHTPVALHRKSPFKAEIGN